MRLTLLRAKEALRHRAPEDRLEYRINRCCERLMLNGKFAGSMHTLRVMLFYGQLALPMGYRTVEGIILEDEDRVLEIANQWYQFLPGHSSMLSVGCNMTILRDLGDAHAIMYDLPAEGTLSTDYDGPPDFPVTIYGTDENAMPVTLVIADNSLAPANPFTHIDRVHKEQGSKAVRLFHTAADSTVTNLAIMAPTTEETYYRRYKIDSLCSTETATALVFAKLRHIEFTSDEDILPFTNISALESMMDSLQYRAENDITLADRYENDAVDVLNKELGDTNADISMPVIRMIYPGGTTPRLTSRY